MIERLQSSISEALLRYIFRIWLVKWLLWIPKKEEILTYKIIDNLKEERKKEKKKNNSRTLDRFFFFINNRAVKLDKQSTAAITNTNSWVLQNLNMKKTCDSFTCLYFIILCSPRFFLLSPLSHRTLTYLQHFWIISWKNIFTIELIDQLVAIHSSYRLRRFYNGKKE